MNTLATTRLSSKGQVVIPEEIRKKLQLESGAQFAVMVEADVVLLKIISPPKMRDFKSVVGRIQTSAKLAGLTKKNLEDVIKERRKK